MTDVTRPDAAAGDGLTTGIHRRSVIATAVALFLGSLALRPQLVSIGPLATVIAPDLDMSHATVGLLTTLPVLSMGLFAPLGPLIASRLGARRAMATALLFLGIFGLVRTMAGTAGPFLAATVGVGIATGIAGALPSILTKLHAPGRPAMVGGAASAGIVAGAVVSAAVVVPLADAAGGWRLALALLAALGLATSAAWFALLGPDPPIPSAILARRPVWRQPAAWLLALVFGLQAVLYWGGGAWLAGTYVERGLTASSAGALIGLLNGSALVGSLSIAGLSDRLGPRVPQIRLSAIGALVACLGFFLAPDPAVTWTVVLGLSLGAIFPLLIVFAVDVSADPTAAGSLSAFVLLVGYVIAALGPLGLGAARDLSGGFQTTFPILLAVAAVLVVVSLGLRSSSEDKGHRTRCPASRARAASRGNTWRRLSG